VELGGSIRYAGDGDGYVDAIDVADASAEFHRFRVLGNDGSGSRAGRME